jgi:hypothetical protein
MWFSAMAYVLVDSLRRVGLQSLRREATPAD